MPAIGKALSMNILAPVAHPKSIDFAMLDSKTSIPIPDSLSEKEEADDWRKCSCLMITVTVLCAGCVGFF
uniref:Uncharacterized protein n=1 Tax=Plectus sambesii TaxID=2011161 RepID=A0A914VJI5_9BILA